MKYEVICGDCLDILKGMDSESVDLVMCSPPYEDCRAYGDLKFNLRGQDWVDWCVPRFVECMRVSRGLVAWVVEGKTKDFRWSATPALLMADLHRQGVRLRKPPVFHRAGIFGGGGQDWLRNDWEFIVCASRGKLPWADNTACGHPPKYPAGGNPSNRTKKGKASDRAYVPPALANPGNVLHFSVGGGHMGHELAHDNEAPFPLGLAEFFIESFCPPNGTVLDPFGGSGTTAHAAWVSSRNSISIDVRESQCDLMRERMQDVICKFQANTYKEFESLWK